MNQQINLTIPKSMLDKAKAKAKEDGHRTVQEYILQALRDKWFLENLPKYEAIAERLESSNAKPMSVEEFNAWSDNIRKKYEKPKRVKIK